MPTYQPFALSPRDSLLPYCAMLLFGLAWLLPLHYPPWASFYNDYAAFLGLLILLVFCTRTSGRNIVMPVSVPVVALVSTIPLLQLAAGTIHFAGDAWIVVAYLLAFALAISSGFTLGKLDFPGLAAGTAWVFVASGAISALFAIYQSLDMDGLGLLVEGLSIYGNRAYANLGQPNQLATLLCLGLAGLLYLRSTVQINLPGSALLGALLILGVALTQSRAPWPGAALLVGWWFAKRRSVPQIKGGVIGAGVILYACLIVFWPKTPVAPSTSASPTISLPRQRADLGDVGTHLLNWQEMARAARKNPWTGYGWNQVAVAHVQSAHERHTYSEMLTHSHNMLLDLVIWNGLPLGLLLIAGLGFWLVTRARRCRTPESWFALGGMALVGTHAMVEYPLEYAYFLLPMGLLAGLVEADHNSTGVVAIPKAGLWIVVSAYTLTMGAVWYEYRIIEEDYRLMRFEERRIGPIRTPDSTPRIGLLTQLGADIRMGRSRARENMSLQELEWMRKITYRYPWYSSLFRYSVSLALNGRREEATVEFRRLYDIYGEKPYAGAKDAVGTLAETQYPQLKNWQLPPP